MHISTIKVMIIALFIIVLFIIILKLSIDRFADRVYIAKLKESIKSKDNEIKNLSIQNTKLQTKIDCKTSNKDIPIIVTISYEESNTYIYDLLKDVGITIPDESQKFIENKVLNDVKPMGFKTRRSDDAV